MNFALALMIIEDLLNAVNSFEKKEKFLQITQLLDKEHTIRFSSEEEYKIFTEKAEKFYADLIESEGNFTSHQNIVFFIYYVSKQASDKLPYQQRKYWAPMCDLCTTHSIFKKLNQTQLERAKNITNKLLIGISSIYGR